MSLDGVIRLLQGAHESDKRAEEILATAITLRDSTGRDESNQSGAWLNHGESHDMRIARIAASQIW